MKSIRKITTGIIAMSLLLLAACSTGDDTTQSIDEKNVIQEMQSENPEKNDESSAEGEQSEQIHSGMAEYEALGIEEYIYPSEFSMGDNLKTAITQLALSFETFDEGSVSSEHWKELFITKFIQNSRVSFEYLDMISDKNDGQIRAEELNYIQYSLTGIELDFSSYANAPINRNDAASSLNYGRISGYDYEYTDHGVRITADFEVGYDGSDSMQKREITVELVKNPYSCFDGYSVAAVSTTCSLCGYGTITGVDGYEH